MTFPKLPPVIIEKVLPAVKNRPLAAASTVVGLVAVGALSLAGGPSTLIAQVGTGTVEIPRAELEAMRDQLNDWLEVTTTTFAPTTTTDAPTTTTSAASTTTTTAAPTTTTTGTPPTTTTTTGPLPVPSGPRWDLIVRATINDQLQGWTAPYFRELPFTPDTGWEAGDRVAYRCAYGFLVQGGVVVGRVTFTRIPEADSYAVVNDRFMESAYRFYDGTLNPDPNLAQLNDCPLPSEAYDAQTRDVRPRVTFTDASGQLLEVRGYAQVLPGPDVSFDLVLDSPTRQTVVAYAEGLPFMTIYYDAMPGSGVTMASTIP